jgi:hypothetical protein
MSVSSTKKNSDVVQMYMEEITKNPNAKGKEKREIFQNLSLKVGLCTGQKISSCGASF